MAFKFPLYTPPDFSIPELSKAPVVRVALAPEDGIAPEHYHATSNHPEYVHIGNGCWLLMRESRMDSVIVLKEKHMDIVEPRKLNKGDPVVIGRTENGEEGILVRTAGCDEYSRKTNDKFSFRTHETRETPSFRSDDQLYEILRDDRKHGHIVWVLVPAVALDKDSRDAMRGLIEDGCCHALLVGNALATHDLEAAIFRTGLGQDIYTQKLHNMGHYNHLDVLNLVRSAGSIKAAILRRNITDGIIYACIKNNVPFVLAGSIWDDGPLPGVIGDVYAAQSAMRVQSRQATTVITLATQLHSIAFGNMLPSYHVMPDGNIRPISISSICRNSALISLPTVDHPNQSRF